jgi:uncharacterized Zn-finger protein
MTCVYENFHLAVPVIKSLYAREWGYGFVTSTGLKHWDVLCDTFNNYGVTLSNISNRIHTHYCPCPEYEPISACLQGMVCSEPGCGEVFTSRKYLAAHARWHEGVREYVCDWTDCEMVFSTKKGLEIHQRTHTGEKPFKCDVCKKCFSQSGNLMRHKKTHIQRVSFTEDRKFFV